jgi:hypothetical protein
VETRRRGLSSTLSRQYRQRQDTGVEQLGIKNDKQRSGNNRSAVRLAVLFGTVSGSWQAKSYYARHLAGASPAVASP